MHRFGVRPPFSVRFQDDPSATSRDLGATKRHISEVGRRPTEYLCGRVWAARYLHSVKRAPTLAMAFAMLICNRDLHA
jgi:hypothetical protein